MAEASWPSPAHNSRSVTDAEYGHLAPWSSDGVFPTSADVVYADSSGMSVHVRANRYGIVQGRAWASGSTEINLSISANSSGLNRTDTVVLRLDRSTWAVTIAVRQGTPGAGAPTLQRSTADTGMWEVPIADVAVDNGVSSIAGTKVRSRALIQSGAIRPCPLISDIQAVLAVGDLVYETTTGRWMAWTTAGAVVIHQDTGYVTQPITGLWKVGGLTPQIRLRGSEVHLRGAIERTTGTLQSTDTNSQWGSVAAQFRPVSNHTWAHLTSSCSAVRLNVAPDGSLAIVDLAADIPVGRQVFIDTSWMVGS
jgi:hypothetical protein